MLETREREVHYDLLRILACWFVIMNHTVGRIFQTWYPSPTALLALTEFFACKTAVPIFLMITGALLMPKRETLGTVLGKRVLRILTVLVAASLIYAVEPCISQPQTNRFDIGEFFFNLATQPITPAFWYLYVLLATMLCLPMLRLLAAASGPKEYAWFLTLWALVAGIVPLIPKFTDLTLSGYLFAPMFYAPLGYLMAGHFFANVFRREFGGRAFSFALAALFVLAIGTGVWSATQEFRADGRFSLRLDGYASITTMIASVSLFLLAVRHLRGLRMPEPANRAVVAVGQSTFGVYLMHMLLLNKTEGLFAALDARMNDMLAATIRQLAVFAAAGAATMLLRRIPGVKKFL